MAAAPKLEQEQISDSRCRLLIHGPGQECLRSAKLVLRFSTREHYFVQASVLVESNCAGYTNRILQMLLFLKGLKVGGDG